jgi:hypothetical protein
VLANWVVSLKLKKDGILRYSLITCLIGAFPIDEKSMSAIFVVNVLPIGN